MEQAIINYVQGHYLESLIVFLIVLLFFKEGLRDLIALGRAKLTGKPPKEGKVVELMKTLKRHFNDETTGCLTHIRETQIEQCVKLNEINEHLRDITRNGVRIRK